MSRTLNGHISVTYMCLAVLLAASSAMAYDTVREGEYVWACIEDGHVVSRHDTQHRAIVDCGRLVDGDGVERHIDFGGLRVFADAPVEPDPPIEPEPPVDPPIEPESCFEGCLPFGSGSFECSDQQAEICWADEYTEQVGPGGWFIYHPVGESEPPVEPPVEPEPPTEPPVDPPVEPELEPEPPVVEPPTAQCGSPYRGIPDPCAALGFDVYAAYAVDRIANGEPISCTGTPADPCVIDVQSQSKVTVTGQYVIVQNGLIDYGTTDGPALNMEGCNFCVVRDVEVFGDIGNFNAGHDSAVALGRSSVWLRGSIHGFGDRRISAVEQDYHGIKVCGSDVWILDAEIYDVSGDSVQVGDASRCVASRVYIGGGYLHHNRENGVDIKDSRDVVVSGVKMEGFRPTSSSPGEVLIVHDDAFDARIFDNLILDTTLGIVSSGAAGHVIEGNTITALREGIQLRNTINLTVRGNTITAPTCVNRQSGVSGEVQAGCE